MRWYARIPRIASVDLSIIANLPYILVGGEAMNAYSLRPSGGDSDILMMSNDAENAKDILEDTGWKVKSTSGGFSATKDGQEVDVLTERGGSALTEIGPEGVSEAIGSSSGHVMSKPWLLVSKILASRDKDMPDLSLLMDGMSSSEVSRTKSIARRYAPWILDIIESEVAIDDAGVKWTQPAGMV